MAVAEKLIEAGAEGAAVEIVSDVGSIDPHLVRFRA